MIFSVFGSASALAFASAFAFGWVFFQIILGIFFPDYFGGIFPDTLGRSYASLASIWGTRGAHMLHWLAFGDPEALICFTG